MSILVSIGLWLLKIASGPMVQAILQKMLENFIQQGKELIPIIEAAIKEAQTHTELSGIEKLKLACDIVSAKFPDMERAALFSTVTAIYEQIWPQIKPA